MASKGIRKSFQREGKSLKAGTSLCIMLLGVAVLTIIIYNSFGIYSEHMETEKK